MYSDNYDSGFSGQQLPYVICGVKKQLIGISCQYVRELVILPQVTQLPDMSSNVRGVFNNRGTIVPVLDLRSRLSMDSSKKELDELVDLLHQREKDHENWINELYNSTVENRPFKLAVDPDKCAFGKWYSSFTTANYILALQLEKFDEPHKIIHSVAHTVEKLKSEGKIDKAVNVIENARGTKLKELVNLFEETRQLLKRTHREMAVITEIGGRNSAIAVDRVESVEPIDTEKMENPPSDFISKEDNIITKIGRRNSSDQFIYILDLHNL